MLLFQDSIKACLLATRTLSWCVYGLRGISGDYKIPDKLKSWISCLAGGYPFAYWGEWGH